MNSRFANALLAVLIKAVMVLLAIAIVVMEGMIIFGAVYCLGNNRYEDGIFMIMLLIIQLPVFYLTIKTFFLHE